MSRNVYSEVALDAAYADVLAEALRKLMAAPLGDNRDALVSAKATLEVWDERKAERIAA